MSYPIAKGKKPWKRVIRIAAKAAAGMVLCFIMTTFFCGHALASESSQSNGSKSSETETESQASTESLLSGYNFENINESLDSELEYGMDFQQLVKSIIEGDGSSLSDGFFKQLKNLLFSELNSNRKALVQVFMLAIVSALFSNFASAFYNPQISETGYMVVAAAMFTILTAMFAVAADITVSAVGSMTVFLKALIPTYFAAVAFSSGSLTAASFYEVIFLVIMVAMWLFQNVLVTGSWLYVMLSMADSMSKESKMSKLAELIKMLVNGAAKFAVVVITGINAIQGLVLPMADSVKSGMLTKALKLIPGIGTGATVLSSTVIGAGTLVKNGIGAAAMVIIIVIAAMPIIKLIVFIVSYKFTAALVQPIADKRMVKTINSAAEGAEMLFMITMSTAIMFLITIAIICATTNMNYAQI